jgi:hypothetical protein
MPSLGTTAAEQLSPPALLPPAPVAPPVLVEPPAPVEPVDPPVAEVAPPEAVAPPLPVPGPSPLELPQPTVSAEAKQLIAASETKYVLAAVRMEVSFRRRRSAPVRDS